MQPDMPDARRDDDLWRSGRRFISSDRPLARLVARPVREFLRIEAAGSVLLLLAAALALIWANSPWSEAYDHFWHAEISLDLGVLQLTESLQHWVNDALMVIFFFVVGLEIKYEIVNGDLRDPKTASLPILAAIGGMLVPAGIYLALNAGHESSAGWGIPMATDIAFAVGVVGLLGRRIPSAARIFLLTLAIVDDIGAILVIAFFYTADLNLTWLAVAVALLAVMVVARVLRIWTIWFYVVIGVGVWLALLESGVHATLAGVAIGLLTPAEPLLKEQVARQYAVRALEDDQVHHGGVGQGGDVADLRFSATSRSRRRMILPDRVLGSSGTTMIWRGFGDRADLVGDVLAQLLDHVRTVDRVPRRITKATHGPAPLSRRSAPTTAASATLRVRHQRRLDLGGGDAVTRHVHHVVDPAQQPDVAVLVELRAVTGEVVPGHGSSRCPCNRCGSPQMPRSIDGHGSVSTR
jgi:hypothetical protein